MKSSLLLMSACLTACLSMSCKDGEASTTASTTATTSATAEKKIPTFNEQEAYQYIAKQVAFGPRIPNTKAQKDCAAFLEATLKASCDTVYRQETVITAKDGKKLDCINLIGSINPQATKRILLLAHWDSRPWADQEDKSKPVLGADDGGSGTAVLMSLANVMKSNPLPADLGIDILLADVEDYGKSEWGDDSYAMGTQYWARNPHVAGYKAIGGILLDMVGAKGARFAVEGNSYDKARSLVELVWASGQQAGYGNYFVMEGGAYITDDHVPVNEILGIPTIDIINLPRETNTGFVKHWHTTKDDMSNIDPATLKAVGQTLLHFLYSF